MAIKSNRPYSKAECMWMFKAIRKSYEVKFIRQNYYCIYQEMMTNYPTHITQYVYNRLEELYYSTIPTTFNYVECTDVSVKKDWYDRLSSYRFSKTFMDLPDGAKNKIELELHRLKMQIN